MPRYKVGNDIFNIPDEEIQAFLAEFPSAVLIEEEVGKQMGVADKGATVTPTTGIVPETQIVETPVVESSVLESVESSLASPSIDKSISAPQYQEVEQDLENKSAQQLNQSLNTNQNLGDDYAGLNPFDGIKALAKLLGKAGDYMFGEPETVDDVGFAESMYALLVNGLNTIGGVDTRAEFALASLSQQVPDEMFTTALGDKLGKKAIEENNEFFNKTNQEMDALAEVNMQTLGFKDIGKKTGGTYVYSPFTGVMNTEDVKTGIAATANGISQFLTSAAISVGTGGVGLASDMVAYSIKDYNDSKAEELGITTEELFNTGQGEVVIPAALGTVGYLLERAGIKGWQKALKNMTPGAKKALFTFLNTGTKEGGTEWVQGGIEELNRGLGAGRSYLEAEESALNYLFSEDGVENFLQGFVGGTGSIAVTRASRQLRSGKDHEAVRDIVLELNGLENSKFRKNLTVEEIADINTAQEELRFNLRNIIDKSNTLAGTLSDGQIENLNANSDFLTTSANRINEIKSSDKFTDKEKEILIQTINKRREVASQNIFDIRSEAEQFYDNLFNVKEAAKEDDNVRVLDFKNADEIQTYLNDNPNLVAEGGRIAASGEQGFFIPGQGDGQSTIIINREKSLNEKAVNVASHEFLHYVLNQTMKKNPMAAINLGNALLRELDKIDINKIKDSNFKKRMELYKDDKVEIQMEEALTLFSDALATGDIQLNADISTLLGDKLRRTFGRLGVNVKFNEDSDVVNFIKDYNNSLSKGKLTKGQQTVLQEGAEGKLIPQAEKPADEQQVKASRTISPRGQEFIELAKQDVFTNESLVETIKSPSSKAEDKFGAIEAIVENNFPVISKAIQFNPTGSIPMDAVKEAVTEQIQGIFPGRNTALFDTYNPEVSKVTTFIDTRLGPRQAEILERAQAIGGTTQGVDITEARGIAVEETTPVSTRGKALAKKPTETVVYSDEVLSNVGADNTDALETRITEEIQTAFEGKDISRFKELKDIPKNITQLYADMFGLSTVDGIVDFKRNFPKLDEGAVRNIRTFLNRNAEDDFRRLPKTKDDKNKATGIKQTKLGKVMYDANDNLVGTLKQYKDILQGKNITLPAYDGQMIEFNRMVDGKKLPIYRDSQHYKAALKFHIQNRIAEDVMPDKAQRLSAGLKFAKSEAKPKAKPKVRQNRFEVSGKNGIVIMRDNAEQFAKANNATIEFEGETITAKNLDSKNPKHRAYVQQQIENELWKYFPLEAIDASTVVGYRDGFYFTKEEWAKTSERAKTNKAEWLARGNKLNYNLEAVKAAKAVKTPPKNKEYYSSDKFKNKLKNWKAGVKAILDGGANAIKADPNMYLPVYAIFSTQSQSSSHLVRNMSVERGASEAFINATKSIPTVKEHVEPSNEMAPLMYEAMLFDEVDVLMPAVDLIYYQLGITKTQDDKTLDVSGMYGDPYNYKTTQTDEFNEALREYFKTGDASKILSPLIRYFNPQVNNNTSEDNIPGFNSNTLIFEGKTVAEIYTKQLTKSEQNNDNLFYQNELTYQVLKGDITQQQAVERLNEFTKIKTLVKASKSNDGKLPPGVRLEDPKTFDKFGMANTVARRMFPKQANSDAVKSGRLTAYEALDPDQKFIVMQEVPGTPIVKQTIDLMATSDQAIRFSRNADAPNKGISVWDFDDTLATTKSNVLYTMPDGTEGTLTAEQFAKQGEQLLEEGAEFDFSEFEKVTKGAKGPMFEKAVARNRKFGNDNVFILTARTQAAAEPIHQFLKAIGLDIPLKNIVGLGNSTPEAKARWVVGKAAEGYNDFYFADDAYKNVKAVQDALGVLDVKSKVRQAYIKHSKSEALDKGFNDILQQTTGIASEKEYKKVKAEVAGASLGRVFRGIPYSAQDFVGLLYETLSKGKLGDAQMAWYKEHLFNPYARAVNDIDNARLSVMQDYRALKKQLGFVPKNLRRKIPGEPYTREQAVRVYIWNKLGYNVPGISKQDLKELSLHVADNADLQVFADQVIAIQKGDYAKPKEGWPAGTITTDIQESINTGVRAKYLTQWQNNVDVIFSEKNMNKLQAAYGKKYRIALENMLDRMKTGRNRRFSDDSLTGRFTDWLQGSIGAIMFFNSRSALLQNLSSINFLNFTDNNPLAAAKAFANQKQYWSDFSKLINSDFLKARRSGLRMNVNEADIADMAKKGGPRAVISKLLQFGFTPTQVADSFAIASGGATFYRNRIKSLMKQGMSQAEAETQAFEDFRETAEESQQSARPDRISMQQAGPLGRLILAFQNTPSQYARIIDKSVRDLKNRRGDAKTNISKIVYYATIQNLIFNALQQALFAFAFDDEEPEDEEKKEKYVNIANSMADSLLRGTGVAGGVMSVTKNAIIRIIRESQKDNPNYEKVGADLQRIAPPISSKLSKINQAARSFKWDKDEMINGGWGLDNPAYLAVGNVVSATTNIPMDRGVKKINNLMKASDSELETWERLALLGGWQDWEIGIDKEPKPKSKKKKSKGKKEKGRVERGRVEKSRVE